MDYTRNWKMLFDLPNLGNLDKPLTTKILSNPNHKITKHIIYLYTMESFIYADMNKACREKDETKIKFYGAFAAALSYIIYFANTKRKSNKLKKTTILYRGLKMSPEIVEAYAAGIPINLTGYTNCCQMFKTALMFAFKDCSDEQVPVVFQIRFNGAMGLLELTDEVTAYPGENEVLI